MTTSYKIKCYGCRARILIYFKTNSTKVERIKAYCSKCSKLLEEGEIKRMLKGGWFLFTDKIKNEKQVEGGCIGETVYIFCNDSRAKNLNLDYEVETNGLVG